MSLEAAVISYNSLFLSQSKLFKSGTGSGGEADA
jgi:hypothetical protein